MRRELTDAEHKLWQEIRDRRLDHIKFRRQALIGNYIVDFVCLRAKLVIELDGGQHSESSHDRTRDAELNARGFRVLRFWNHEILKEIDAGLRHDHCLRSGSKPAAVAMKRLGSAGLARGHRARSLDPSSVPSVFRFHGQRSICRRAEILAGHLLPQGEKGEPGAVVVAKSRTWALGAMQ
jgi:very-short-patch-repair endonuclease